MASEWGFTRLSDLVTIKHGFAFAGEYFTGNSKETVLLTPGNFRIGGGFKEDKPKGYSGTIPEEYVLRPGDLIVTMTDLSRAADTLGYPALVPLQSNRKFLHNQRLGKVEIRKGAELDHLFLYYLLCSKPYRDEVVGGATGSTVKHTSPSRIMDFGFRKPSLKEQNRIGETLYALDQRIIAAKDSSVALESIAWAIFKSWFVDFNPVQAKAEGREPEGMDADTAALFPSTFEDSELGPIPQGWTTGPITHVLSLNPTRSLKKKVTATYLDMASVPTSGPRATSWIKRDFVSGSKFINGDTLLARITPCLENGKTAYVDFLEQDEVGWGSTEFIVMATKPNVPSQFVYLLARDPEFRQYAIQSMSGTSGRQRVQVDQLAMFKIAIANDSIYRAFGTLVEPLFQRIKYSSEEQTTLTALRDTLLPRLISGKLRVPEAEAMLMGGCHEV